MKHFYIQKGHGFSSYINMYGVNTHYRRYKKTLFLNIESIRLAI